MIELPDSWRQWVQVRDIPSANKAPHARSNVIGVVMLVLGNDSEQCFGYELPVVVPWYLLDQTTKSDQRQFFELAYNTLLQQVPDIARKQQSVFGRDPVGHLSIETVADQNWQPLWDEMNVPYEQFLANLN